MNRTIVWLGGMLGVLLFGGNRYSLGAEASAPVPLSEAVARITVPPGFQPTLFAGEPDVVQPIAMTTDARGRLWVVECLSYPDWKPSGEGNDRISIFEDTDGDGRFDSKKVFWDKGRNLSGIAVGLGGVFLCSVPELIFLQDADGDDHPDGPPEALLDGWDLKAQHNVFNGLSWGPDGWLYGCNGILSNVKVGKPGAPEGERVSMNCGVWRYHPTKRVFEAVAHGTTNPWGIAFDRHGRMFVANCVIKHLFHIIPGARYERMFGQDGNPYAFELIPSIADHIHWAGGFWKTEGAEHPQNDTVGGGHAHSGAMIYQGTRWPAEFRDTFFTVNIHGHRVNNDRLLPQGSGFVGQHRPDFVRVNDAWFRGVAIVPSHDGNAYVADWSDAGECHDYEDIHRENGRIYKISYGAERVRGRDLRQLSDRDLIAMQAEGDGWSSAQARLLLQERAAKGGLAPDSRQAMAARFRESTNEIERLRILWTLHVTGGTDGSLIGAALKDGSEHVRAWGIQLALEEPERFPGLSAKLSALAAADPSPVVRLALASGLQRLPLDARVPIAQGLLSHEKDQKDHNLPLLIWYGIEPIASTDEGRALALLEKARLSKPRRFIAQRLTLRAAMNGLSKLLVANNDAGLRRDIVLGMHAALNGRRDVPPPSNWTEARKQLASHPDKETRRLGTELSLIFGDKATIAELSALVADTAALTDERRREERRHALQALIQVRAPGLPEMLHRALENEDLRLVAIRGLAAYDHSDTPRKLLAMYPRLTAEEKAEAISTLSSRANYAMELLQGVRAGVVAARDITPFAARQMAAHREPRLNSLLKEIGTVRDISREKAEQIAHYKELLAPAALQQANLSRGRAVFNRACAACHTLFNSGGTLAPELTGSQRTNLDYLLENMIDPNAVVWDQYKAAYFETSDDRLISGVVLKENESTVTIQTQTGTITLPRKEIVGRTQSQLSMMPEGLLDMLDPQEVIDLIAYLQSPEQVPLPEE